MFVQPATKTLYGYSGDFPCMLPSVVLRGNDSTLLSTRKMILELAGLSVRSVLGSHAFDDDAAVLVVCFTLTVAEKVEAVRRFRIHVPRGSILILGDGISDPSFDGCEVLAAYPGPELFSQKVCQLALTTQPN